MSRQNSHWTVVLSPGLMCCVTLPNCLLAWLGPISSHDKLSYWNKCFRPMSAQGILSSGWQHKAKCIPFTTRPGLRMKCNWHSLGFYVTFRCLCQSNDAKEKLSSWWYCHLHLECITRWRHGMEILPSEI